MNSLKVISFDTSYVGDVQCIGQIKQILHIGQQCSNEVNHMHSQKIIPIYLHKLIFISNHSVIIRILFWCQADDNFREAAESFDYPNGT